MHLLNFKINFSILHVIFLVVGGVKCKGDEGLYPNDDICGMTEEKKDDLRTFSPWNVVIYMRRDLKSPYEYFLTGSLINKNTVISGFGGGFGQSPYKNKRYFIPPPSHFLIAAALKSTNLSDSDEHMQFTNCSYVAAHQTDSSNFHYVIFRLQQNFRIQTPYVRPLCMAFPVKSYFQSIGLQGNKFDDTIFLGDIPIFVGGFDAPPGATKPYKPVFVLGKGDFNMRCRNSYKFHYKPEPGEQIACFRMDSADISNSTCLTHGSSFVWKTSKFDIDVVPALGPEPCYFLNGAVSLIPRKNFGECSAKTVFYVYPIITLLDWVKDHMLCQNPQTFPCSNGTCIPLEQLCDEKQDCAGGEDEEPIYCSATKRCSNLKDYQCGYEGKCIRLSQVGDGIIDCPSRIDEDTKLLNNTRFSKGVKSKTGKKCFPLLPTEGVVVKCTHHDLGRVSCSNASSGSKAIFGCAPQYSSQQKFNYANMECFDDGTWKPYRTFHCQPECGILGKEVNQALVVNGITVESKTAFPWHAAIFRPRSNDSYLEYICGASLIERNVIITAGHCTTDNDGNSIDMRRFRIVLNSISINLTDNESNKEAQIFEVEAIWRPYSFNAETRQSDIAVVKLTRPVVYTQTIRPICYIMKKYSNLPRENSIGTIPGFGVTKTGRISKSLKYANFRVAPTDDCFIKFHDKFCTRSKNEAQTICYGDSGGGLVFPTEKSSGGLDKFILKGIASELSQPQGIRCDAGPNGTSVFTHLDSHTEWLLTTLEEIDINPDL